MMNRKRLTFLTIPLLPLAGITIVWTVSGCKRATPQMQSPDVMVMDVIQTNVPIYGDWIGTLDGLVNAQINAQVSGYLLSQSYKEGAFVHKGDLLFEIDPRPFQAALDKARGQLAQAQAQLGKTELDVKRYTPLAKTSAISQEELDDAVQANLAAKAAVDSAQAQVQQAELNLGFTRITSPIDGIAGIAEAQVGDLVGPSSPKLTMVSTVDPIKAYFPISEQEYMLAMDHLAARRAGAMAGGHSTNNLELILANGSVYPHRGTIVIADRQVNIRTGTIRIAGLFPNPDNILRPGQYAHVRMAVQMRTGALLVPQRAVTEMQGIYQIAVVDKNNRVSIRTVQMDERSGPFWIVTQGLNPGERVVVEGTQKIREGISVNAKPYQPNAHAAPDPATHMPAQGIPSHP